MGVTSSRGRAQWLARELKKIGWRISHQGTQKWLDGETIPSQPNIIRLSKILHVNAQWLQAGPGDRVVPAAAGDEIARELAFIWPHLTPDDRRKILSYAQLAALPNKHDEAEAAFEFPSSSAPVRK